MVGNSIAKGETMEVSERVDNLEKKVERIETRITFAERDIKGINKKLDKIDNNTTWIVRLIVGAIIYGVIKMIIKG